MATSSHNKNKCLKLGVSYIGSKSRNIGGDVIDDIAKQKLASLPDGMLERIENYLQDRFPEVYNNTLNKILSIPENYDYGVGTKMGIRARAMQYGDENEAKKRIFQIENSKELKDLKEKSHLKEVLEDKTPLKCEDMANRRFIDFFKNEPGLFLHAFKPKEYMVYC